MMKNASQLRLEFRQYAEGALSSFGLFWIPPIPFEGKPPATPIMVNDISGNTNMSHEEWANRHGFSLEKLLKKGWVRLQVLANQYFIADHQSRKGLTSDQQMTLFRFLSSESKFPQIVMETPSGIKQFRDSEENREEALNYLCAA